jgi:porphobilinogen synthase
MLQLEVEQTLFDITCRPRRNRRTAAIRSLVEENHLRASDLVAPYFVIEGESRSQPIDRLPGVSRISVDLLLREAEKLHKAGVPAIALFPVIDPSEKNPMGSAALDEDGIVPRAIEILKKEIPSLCIISDIALDPFTSHGHDGVVNDEGCIVNDATVEILSRMALLFAQKGIDLVAPSDMMDGRIGAIRKTLDANNFYNTGIVAYTAKYASALYSPFRDALGSFPKFGDKKTYQMNPANSREALRQTELDVAQGADMVMVKPALYYLDIIAKMRAETNIPICAYHVSGEYAMVMAAHEKGYLDASKVFYEALLSIKRAGAEFIFTYAIPQILHLV